MHFGYLDVPGSCPSIPSGITCARSTFSHSHKQRFEQTHNSVQVGNTTEGVSSTYSRLPGTVELISSELVQIRPLIALHHHVIVNLKSANFSLPSNALTHSAGWSCNVKPGGAVMVVSGSWIGRRGIVRAINLQQKILEVYPLADFVCISPLSAWFTNFLSGTFLCTPLLCAHHTCCIRLCGVWVWWGLEIHWESSSDYWYQEQIQGLVGDTRKCVTRWMWGCSRQCPHWYIQEEWCGCQVRFQSLAELFAY